MSIRSASVVMALLSLGGAADLGCALRTSDAAAADPEFQSAAEELTIANNAVAPGEEAPVTSASITTGSLADPTCHPHLFERSVQYSRALNYHVYLFVRDVDLLLLLRPHVKTATTHEWVYSSAQGVSVQVKLTKSAPGVFSMDLSLAPQGSSTYVSVATGTVDRSNPDDLKKSMSFDFDALHTVLPAGTVDKAAGQLAGAARFRPPCDV